MNATASDATASDALGSDALGSDAPGSDATASDAAPDRDPFVLAHRLRVRWAEADMQGVVFNAHYLAYFDLAVTEYWRAVAAGDADWLRRTFERLFVVKATVEFHAPARFDEELDVLARCARIGRSSMTFAFEIRRAGERLISGENVYVHASDGRSEPVPDDLRARITAFERVAPG